MSKLWSNSWAKVQKQVDERSTVSPDALAGYAVQMARALNTAADGGLRSEHTYPITAGLRECLKDDDVDETQPWLYAAMLEVVGEYEHGSADCPVLPELYAIVLADFAVCFQQMTKDRS